MTTKNKSGETVRGFVVEVTSGHKREQTVSYGTDAFPLSLEEAAKVCREAIKRGHRCAAETDGPGGREYIGGKELVELADYAGPAMIDGDARTTAAEMERQERRAKLAELANRRLFAADLDTTPDFVDPLKAENPLLAFRF